MSTVLDYYMQELPNGYRQLAIRNVCASSSCREVEGIYQAIDRGMHWTETPEGHDFWSRTGSAIKIDEWNYDYHKLPTLPKSYSLPCANPQGEQEELF